MFGAPAHADINALGNALTARRWPLVVSHGGVGVGSFPSNTWIAVKAAVASGADVVKIDVAASTDNIFFAFHDGFEPELLGEPRNIQSLSAAEIAERSYIWHDRPGHRARVERLLTLLDAFRGEELIFALDRSWWRWPTLLKLLDQLDMPQQVLLKVPAREAPALEKLRAHRTKYPVLAICSTPLEYAALPEDPDVNVVGVELIAAYDDEAWFRPDAIADIHADDRLAWINSETLTTGVPLFGGYDDERAIRQGPDAAWGRVFDLGVDAIQTALPWLLRDYRDSRAWRDARASATLLG